MQNQSDQVTKKEISRERKFRDKALVIVLISLTKMTTQKWPSCIKQVSWQVSEAHLTHLALNSVYISAYLRCPQQHAPNSFSAEHISGKEETTYALLYTNQIFFQESNYD